MHGFRACLKQRLATHLELWQALVTGGSQFLKPSPVPHCQGKPHQLNLVTRRACPRQGVAAMANRTGQGRSSSIRIRTLQSRDCHEACPQLLLAGTLQPPPSALECAFKDKSWRGVCESLKDGPRAWQQTRRRRFLRPCLGPAQQDAQPLCRGEGCDAATTFDPKLRAGTEGSQARMHLI